MGCLHSLISTLDFVSDVGFREPQDPELCQNSLRIRIRRFCSFYSFSFVLVVL